MIRINRHHFVSLLLVPRLGDHEANPIQSALFSAGHSMLLRFRTASWNYDLILQGYTRHIQMDRPQDQYLEDSLVKQMFDFCLPLEFEFVVFAE